MKWLGEDDFDRPYEEITPGMLALGLVLAGTLIGLILCLVFT